MAAKVEQSKWRTVVEASVDAIEDTGDILAPLKSLRAAYIRKADELAEKACGDNSVAIYKEAASYTKAAEAVGALIGSLHVAQLEESAPIDTSETILSDDGKVPYAE